MGEKREILGIFDVVTMWQVRVSTPPIWLLLNHPITCTSRTKKYRRLCWVMGSKTDNCADDVFKEVIFHDSLGSRTTHGLGGRGNQLSWRGRGWGLACRTIASAAEMYCNTRLAGLNSRFNAASSNMFFKRGLPLSGMTALGYFTSCDVSSSMNLCGSGIVLIAIRSATIMRENPTTPSSWQQWVERHCASIDLSFIPFAISRSICGCLLSPRKSFRTCLFPP